MRSIHSKYGDIVCPFFRPQICLQVDRSRRARLLVRVDESRREDLVTVSDVFSLFIIGSIIVRTREREREREREGGRRGMDMRT